MTKQFDKSEKKVEYIELIYDLIFVYLIGRNNSLLDRIEGGFVSSGTFLDYIISSLIILQIWFYSTVFINRFGRNGLAEKLMHLINMFMLYIIGANTINGWTQNYGAYMGAWILILINLAAANGLKLRSTDNILEQRIIRETMAVLFIQAAVIAISIPVYIKTGFAFGQWSVLIGLAASFFLTKAPMDFEHLTERNMLYVVFTFGEMVIIVAEYFNHGFSLQTLYFAAISFLTVSGLFFSYGFIYDKLLDRKRPDSGTLYMLLHVFIAISLSCITTALDFMRNESVAPLPRTIMLVISLLVFFICLALTEHWSHRVITRHVSFNLILIAEFMIYATAAIIGNRSGYVIGAATVIFIYIQLATLVLSERYTVRRE